MKQNHLLALSVCFLILGVGLLLIWKSSQPAVLEVAAPSSSPKTVTATKALLEPNESFSIEGAADFQVFSAAPDPSVQLAEILEVDSKNEELSPFEAAQLDQPTTNTVGTDEQLQDGFIVRVTDRIGTPVPAALVSYAHFPTGSVLAQDASTSSTMELTELYTNERGETIVPFVPDQDYRLFASATIWHGKNVINSSVASQIFVEQESPGLVMLPLGFIYDETKDSLEEPENVVQIRGIVVTESGDPVPDVNILAKNTENNLAGSYTTTEDGMFILSLPEGTFNLYATPLNSNGYNENPNVQQISFTAQNPPQLIRFVLPEGDVVDGIVLDSTGLPIPGVLVTSSEQLRTTVRINDSVIEGFPSFETQTDESGYFRFAGLPKNGAIRSLSFTAEGYEPHQRVQVTMLESPLAIQLKKASGVVVYVVWEGDNSPVTEFSYRLAKSGFNDFEIDTGQQGRRITSLEGKFELVGLDQGDYRVEVNLTDENGDPIPVRDAATFTIDAEDEQQEIVLTMVGGYDVRGTVENAETGAFVPNAQVSFVPPWGGYSADSILLKLDLEETTDANGKFRFEGIPPGRYTLQVVAEGVTQKVPFDFEVEGGSPPAPFTLPVYKGGKVFGYVTAEDGSAVSDAQLTLSTQRPNIDGWNRAETRTDDSGYYEFTNLSLGTAFLDLRHKSQNDTEHLDLELGEEKRVDFDFSESVELSGIVTVNGKPYFEDFYISLVSKSNGSRQGFNVENNRYTTKLLPGHYKVKSSLSTGEGETISVKKGSSQQTIDIDIRIASATLIATYPDGTEFKPGKVVLQPENMAHRYIYPRYEMYTESQFIGALAAGEYRATFVSMDGEWLGDSGLVQIGDKGKNTFLMEVNRKPNTNRIGGWQPNEISVYPTSKRLDLTPHIKQSGSAIIYLEYEKGRHALACQSAILLQNGSIISTDNHESWAGNDVVATTYYLSIPEYNNTARYEVELTLRCDGGSDSTGSIYLEH